MSGSGGVTTARSRVENRFYVPPALRKASQQHQHQQQQKQQKQKHQQQNSKPKPVVVEEEEEEKRRRGETEEDQCGSLNCSVSGWVKDADCDRSSNLDRFLEFTTPLVPARFLPETNSRGWRAQEELDSKSYFVLGDLWETFKESSAYGAGVPLVINGSETVVQYYVPYLSGIQLYVDPSKPSSGQRSPGEGSATNSSRESSGDGCSSDCGMETRLSNGHHLSKLAFQGKNSTSSSSDEQDIPDPPGQLIFQFMEFDPPFTRQPLADQISTLASRFPKLKTCRSCDLSPSSWMSVAWYPIYRIPMGPTLQNLDACFLTFHSLSTPLQDQGTNGVHLRSVKGARGNISLKLPLPTFGLASYKLKVSFWNPSGTYECQKVTSLQRAADNWLRLLSVNHPDYSFFASHEPDWR